MPLEGQSVGVGDRIRGGAMTEPEIVHEYRKRLVEVWESVTPAHIDSPEAQRVAQGRQHHTSTCADLAHYGYEEVGLRHRQINRAPHWRVGVNVSRLAWWPEVTRIAPPRLEGVMGGDVLIRWANPSATDAHVVCVLAHHELSGALSTAEYGQGRPMIGRLFTRLVEPEKGQRPWQRWLPLGAVLRACGVEGC